MAAPNLSAAKAILLAVHLATKSDVQILQNLVAQHRSAFRTDIILRILLTYLPETLDSTEYIPLLLDITSESSSIEERNSTIDSSFVDNISDTTATKQVRKLQLLPLTWPGAPPDALDDHLVLFLIHRAYKIDEETGLITQLPALIIPFLERSTYLRTWMISTLLPLLRLHYEYYPQESIMQTIEDFEALSYRAGVELLLSQTGKDIESRGDTQKTVGRDLKGLIGPWIYGDTRWKRRRMRRNTNLDAQTIPPLDNVDVPIVDRSAGWEEVFKWITSQATNSWITCVEAIEQWDGPGDVDLGGYSDGTIWLQEEEQQHLEARYARAALASAYLIPEASVEALTGVQRILARLVGLMDYDRIPTLPAAAALLSPIPRFGDNDLVAVKNATFLRNGLLDTHNPFTAPNKESVTLLHGLLISAFILTRAGVLCTIRRAGELIILKDEREQIKEVQSLMNHISNGPKGDDKYWIRIRNEILWLRDWGAEELSGITASEGSGVFGKVKKDFLEKEILKALLANTRYTLAQSIYEASPTHPLSKQQVKDTVITAAMNAFDNATNPNRTRGGVKKCNDIIHAFPDTFEGSIERDRLDSLLVVTHTIGNYRLVLKQGEPFTPVILRVHGDPISLIGNILDQNSKSYTRIHELLDIGEGMVKAGLTLRDVEGHSTITSSDEEIQINIAKRRITSMCIAAALDEDDFETAYSYVMNRLNPIAKESEERSPRMEHKGPKTAIAARPPPKIVDDWSWRAAMDAGKYRYNEKTIRPTHLGNSSGNLGIRHIQQRMECLSMSLRIAPPATLPEILNAFRRCEEELDVKLKEEADQEAAWDEQGDQTSMPGGFGAGTTPKAPRITTAPRGPEDAPMSIFDLTRASAAQAQRSLSSLTTLAARDNRSSKSAEEVAREHRVEASTVRKRDQLRNAAVNTLAGGIGWLINAPPAEENVEK